MNVLRLPQSIDTGYCHASSEAVSVKAWLVLVTLAVMVESFFTPHWTSWLLLFAGVGMTTYCMTNKK